LAEGKGLSEVSGMGEKICRDASLTQADIDSDTRLCLDEAARLAFPDGTVSARTLRAEAARGKLAIFRIGKKYYTTLAEIDRMVERCPVPPRVRISTSDAGPAANHAGQSETEAMSLARAALEASVRKLKKDCRKPK
jgi:hypothetical protein